ncbi:MAG: hypothetical protein IPK82_08470 [Polyangiaceae bacterium]|nr:hypothetical protein [Polyangiaceae bacterium]
MNTPASVRPTPSLRIEELGVQAFRTFKERVLVPFREGRRPAEPISALHGASCAGKSNLIAAVGAFFKASELCLNSPTGTHDVPANTFDPRLPITKRDRFRMEAPTEIDIRFADQRLLPLRLSAAPQGDALRYALTFLPPNEAPAPGHVFPAEKMRPLNDEIRAWLRTWLCEPLGSGSRPFARLAARDASHALSTGTPRALYPLPSLADELYRHRTSLDPMERDLWHRFLVAIRGLPPFENREIGVEWVDDAAEIVLEDRGRTVIRFHDLSASEQQALALAAFSFFSRAAVLAIEYPETHLDNPMKKALLTLLQRRIDAGRIDQVFLETHETQFDGPTVLRVFKKNDHYSDVTRGPSVGEAPADIDKKGRESGAKQGWVTRDGYTQLPDAMREELHLTLGGHVWFLKGKSRWEAWPGQELERLFPDEDTDDRDPE